MIEALRATIETLILQILGPIDTWACYLGTVVSQAGNLLDVKLDDQRFGPGITKLDYDTGIPGATVTVPKGARVVVAFRERSRSKPYVAAFVSGTPIQITIETSDSVTIKGAAKVELDGTQIQLGATALKGVARMLDTVQAGPFAGTITSGSLTVKAQD